MGRQRFHAAITAGLAVTLATSGVQTAAIAQTLGIEAEPAAEVDPTAAGKGLGGASTTPRANAAEPEVEGRLPADGAWGADSVDLPPWASAERPQEDEFYVETEMWIYRWIDPGQTIDVPLPKDVRIRYNDGRCESVPVTWTYDSLGMERPQVDIVDGVAKSLTMGYHVFTTTIKGKPRQYSVQVNERTATDAQDAIQSVEPVVDTLYTTGYGDPSEAYDPGLINVTMADGEVKLLEPIWDDIPRELYDGDEDAGEFTVKGVIEQYGNYPVEATVIVAVPREQRWAENVSTPAGTLPTLPDCVGIAFSNGAVQDIEVTWDMPAAEVFSKPGVVYVKGSIPGSKFRPQVKVKVQAIKSMEPLSDRHALVGNALRPEEYQNYAYVTYSDGVTGSVPIIWDPVDESAFAAPGVIEIKGRLQGYSDEVTSRIHVHDKVLNPVVEKRLAVGADPLSATTNENFELAQYNSSWFDVDWNRAQLDQIDYNQAGAHLIDGVIQNTDIHVQMSLNIVGIDHVVAPTTVKTLTGVMPQLLQTVDVVYTDGKVQDAWVDWDAIQPSKYANEGEFVATGTYNLDNLTSQSITCPVKVLKAQAPASIDAVTLAGRAPELPEQVKVTMWDGTVVHAKAQWENPDPQGFAQPGTFDVHGFLLGSQIEIVAHVRALGLKSEVVAECGYYPGAPETIQINNSLELENGDPIYVPSIVWDPFPEALRRGEPGTYEVGGTIAESPVRVKALVTTGRLLSVWANDDIIIPAGSELVLPATVSGEIDGGHYVSETPVAWDEYDKNPQHDITVTGHIAGHDQPIVVTVHVVTEPKFDISTMFIKRGFNAAEHLPQNIQVTVPTESGSITTGDPCSVSWNTDGVDWGESGTISGIAHVTEIGYAKDVPVTIDYKVLDSIKVVCGQEHWTEPGVAPNLDDFGIQVDPESGGWTNPWIEWEGIDPSLYSKPGSTFTVKGTIVEMGFDVETTVHVAEVTSIEVPESVSTPNGERPHLPYEVPVHWSDVGTTMEYVNWDNVPGSAYKGEPGKTTTVYGSICGAQGAPLHQVSIKVVIVAPTVAYDNGELDVTTQAGIKPFLPGHVAARMSDDTVSISSITWDPIPAERYRQPGTFEATGRIEGYSPSRARFFHIGGNDINVAPDGTVKATVTVKPEESKPVPLQPEVLATSVVQGSTEDFTVPTHVPVLMSNVGNMATPPLDAWHTVSWDVTGLKLDVPGSYRITGAIDGFDDIQAVAYVNVLPRPRTVKSVEPFELSVTQGSLAADVDVALLREVKVEYEDGSTGIVKVEAWDMTPITDDALKSEGDIKIEGRLVGSKMKASAIVHVVADPAKVPVRAVAPKPIEVREGSKLSTLVKKLPAKVFVEMKNGDKREFDVTWDTPRALGKSGSEQVVAGVTSNGMKVSSSRSW